jgi:futalosine hydrolase
MNCLVVAATPIEIAPLIGKLPKSTGKNKEIDILISGIGLLATTYALQKQISIKRPDLIIQAGVGGCFDKKIALGKVMAIKQDCVADQSVVELKELKTLFDLQLVPADQFPYKKGWLVNPSKGLRKLPVPVVNAISVNEITTDPERVNLYKKLFSPVIESMEGAALHYVCLKEKISFLQLRSVSNYIAERNKKNWKIDKAVTSLNKVLLQVLKQV